MATWRRGIQMLSCRRLPLQGRTFLGPADDINHQRLRRDVRGCESRIPALQESAVNLDFGEPKILVSSGPNAIPKGAGIR
jgi:hypothetical protein